VEQMREAVKNVPCRYRQTLRGLSEKVGIPRSTLHRLLKQDGLTTAGGNGDEGVAGEKNEAAQEQRQSVSQKVQQDMIQIKLQQDMKEHYERKTEKAVKEAKREARREHDLHLESIRGGLQEQNFQGEKNKVLCQFRVEIERHQLELARLKGELDKIGVAGAAK